MRKKILLNINTSFEYAPFGDKIWQLIDTVIDNIFWKNCVVWRTGFYIQALFDSPMIIKGQFLPF